MLKSFVPVSQLLLQDPTDKIVLMFSHDINIHFLRQLLGLSWVSRGYAADAAVPGGSLSFELWINTSESAKSYFVMVYSCLIVFYHLTGDIDSL
jgi:hypothetical protein